MLSDKETIKNLEPDEPYKYLGVDKSDDIKHNLMKAKVF